MGFLRKGFFPLGLTLLLMATMLSCGGSSSGGGGGNPSTPAISNIFFTPASLPHGTTVNNNLSVSFDWTDGGGDLNGGTLTLVYQGTPITTSLNGASPAITAGSTSGHVNQLFLSTFTLDNTTGIPSIQIKLTDQAGNVSQAVFVTTFTQT